MAKTTCFLATISLLFLAVSAVAQSRQSSPNNLNKDLKFLEDISIDAASSTLIEPVLKTTLKTDATYAAKKEIGDASPMKVEKATALQFKYALLLDVEVEMVKNMNLFKMIDDWYGVRYVFGGTGKSGIDCSALMQVFFTALYGASLPRTAKQQFDFSRRISRTELREGDLVFFNTRGGISHVGMYLSNNKFVHASTTGVVISSLYDEYYANRFVGVGRVDVPVASNF